MNTQKPHIRSAEKMGPWALAFLLWIFIFPSASSGETILVIRERGAAFEKALMGLQDELENEMEIRELVIGAASPADTAIGVIQETQPVMAVLMDNRAIGMFRVYQASLADPALSIPSVSCMGIDIRSAVKEIRNAVGISYEVPIVTSLVGLRAALNRPLKKAGIIHRKWQRAFIEENRNYCSKEGIELITRELPDDPVAFRTALRPALESLLSNEGVQSLWVPNDNVLLTPELIQDIWSPLIGKYKVPAVVGVETLVNPALDMGTFAVLPDHRAMGAQAAEFILNTRDNGWKVWEGMVEPPVAVKKTVNLRQMAQFFGLEKKDLGNVDTFLVMEKGMDIRLASSRGGSPEQLSLADLLNMEVTSVSKKSERLMDVPSSIYVISEEDIQRSGATRLQEILNLVPGVWFGDNNYYLPETAIRETPHAYPLSVNVLIDGVPLISPINGGVNYHGLTIPVSEIKRVEVIKGPGGTIYGANSATGIVNIITRSAEESGGLYAHVRGGGQGYIAPYVSYGGRRGLLDLAVYGEFNKHNDYDKNPDFIGDRLTVENPSTHIPQIINNNFTSEKEDRRTAFLGGAKADARLSERITLKSWLTARHNTTPVYASKAFPWPDTIGPKPADSMWLADQRHTNMTANLLLDCRFTDFHNAFMRSFYSDTRIHNVGLIIEEFDTHEGILNFELQDNLNLFREKPLQLEIISGANLRQVHFHIHHPSASGKLRYTEPENDEYLWAGFLQGKLTFLDRFDLVLGVKGETWTLISTEPEYSPSFRAALRPNEDFTFWTAWSRSVTTPGYNQTNLEFSMFQIPPAWIFAMDSSAYTGTRPGYGKWGTLMTPEDLAVTSYYTAEIGARTSCIPKVVVDFSTFHSLYRGKVANTAFDTSYNTVTTMMTTGDTVIPLYYGNSLNGSFYGVEGIVKINPFKMLRWEGSYALLLSDVDANARNINGQLLKGLTLNPEHIIRSRLYLDLPSQLRVTINSLWHSAYSSQDTYNYQEQRFALEGTGPGAGGIIKDPPRARFKLDVILEKRLLEKEKLVLYLWGKNLLYGHYVEAFDNSFGLYPNTVHRTFGGGVSYRF